MERISEKTMKLFWVIPGLLLILTAGSQAAPLDQMETARWAKLREVERYQLNIAEKLFAKKEWKVASAEYEKYIKLYERSDAASYAQLKWSLCQVHQRLLNTAIRDGFKSVMDYWPDSPEAVAASYYVGQTYKNMGDLSAAKKAYTKVIEKHAKHFASLLARMDLLDIAKQEKDEKKRLELLKQITFDVERNKETSRYCVLAARELSQHHFNNGEFADGLKALGTCHKEEDLHIYVVHNSYGRVPVIVSGLYNQKEPAIKQRGIQLADAAIKYLQSRIALDLKDEKTKDRGISAWYSVAELHGRVGRATEQKATYEQMLKTLGNHDGTLSRLADWYKAHKQRDLARQTYQRFTNKVNGLSLIATSWREEKNWNKAIETYHQLESADMKNSASWTQYIASTWREARKPDEAIAVYRGLLTSDAKNATSHHWQIAETLYQFGRWKEALQAYRGTENFPANYQRMATCNRRLKQYKEAILLYQQIVTGHKPSASWATLQIGYVQEEAGKKEAAIKAFKLVCSRYPKSGDASTAHVRLNDKYGIRVTLGGSTDK